MMGTAGHSGTSLGARWRSTRFGVGDLQAEVELRFPVSQGPSPLDGKGPFHASDAAPTVLGAPCEYPHTMRQRLHVRIQSN